MKKFFTLLLALTATLAAWSDGTEINGIYYLLAGDSATVTYMGRSPYSGNSYSGSVTIPSSVTYSGTTYRVTSIGDDAFRGCSGLTSITIPNSITSIGEFAFQECTGLTSITIPNSVTSIGSYAFWNCTGLTSITIPNSVTSIGGGAFSGCSGLNSITVDSNNPTYDSRNNCNAIIETASNTVIAGCKNTVIPNSVTSIGSYAFWNCTGLTSITIPNSVTKIGNSAFLGCTGLNSITVDSNNPTYDSRNNCNAIIETASNTVIAGCKNTVIPNSVTSIGDGAFSGCSSLTSITIPNSITSIGVSAFLGCKGLTSVTIPNSITSIGVSAFSSCSGLTSVIIGNSVTSIGDDAFSWCSGLTSVTCYATTPPTCGNFCFNNVNTSILYVPATSISLYQAADVWKYFTNIKAIGATDTTLSVNQPVVTPENTDVTIIWPTDSSADTYTITITKNGETVCILTFDAQGQLTNIAFAPARGASQGNQATQTVNGYQFTVTGLEAGTNYNYTVTTSANGTTLSTQSGSFTTGTTALTDIQAPNTAADGKYFLGGHLYIQKAGHLYTPAGHQLK